MTPRLGGVNARLHPIVALSSGLLLGLLAGFGAEAIRPGCGPWAGLALGLALAWWLRAVPRRLGALAAGVCAVAASQVSWQRPPEPLPAERFREDRSAAVTGRVASPPRRTLTGLRVELDDVTAEGTPLPGRLVLSVPRQQRTDALATGAELSAQAVLRRIQPTPTPGVADPAALMLNRGLVARGRALTLRVSQAASSVIDALRDRFRDAVAGVQPETASLLEAMLLGDQGTLTAERQERWRRAGITHILSISGLHVAVVALAGDWALRLLFGALPWWVRRWSARRPAAIGAIGCGWLYVLVAGAPIAAVRSGLMVSALFGARALGRVTTGASALGLAALVTLLGDPWAIRDPSFQLSYTAVAGLIVGAPAAGPAAEEAGRLRRAGRALWGAMLTSGVCTLATLPILLAHFGAVSISGLVTNLVAVPLSSVAVVIPGFAALVGAALGVHTPAPWLSDQLVPWLDTVARWGALVPELRRAGPSAAELVLMSGGVVLCLLGARIRRRLRWLGAALVVVSVWGLPRVPHARLELTFLAVGHGDAMVIRLPDGRALLVDGGGDPTGYRDVGRTLTLPGLSALGIDALDAVVLSHPHPDHYRGLVAVLQSLPVKELWWNGQRSRDPEFVALMAAAAAQGTQLRIPEGVVTLGEVALERLHPLPRQPAPSGLWVYPSMGLNDNSLVLRLRYGAFSVLLAGDIEGPAEHTLVESGKDLHATVLKVPHHGSRTSSSAAFLAAVAPAYAVCGSADQGRFAFPHAEVEARYAEMGIPLWITGRYGAVQIVSDGQDFEVSPLR